VDVSPKGRLPNRYNDLHPALIPYFQRTVLGRELIKLARANQIIALPGGGQPFF
jgi:hypothetical protein